MDYASVRCVACDARCCPWLAACFGTVVELVGGSLLAAAQWLMHHEIMG